MREIEIHTFTEFHEVIATYDERTIIYRGVNSLSYPLIPKIGRNDPPDSLRSREANEKEILRLFKERALRFLDFMYRGVGKFIPRHISPRITNQGGLFTIQPKPYEPFESEDMEKLIIPNQIRSTLKRTLNKYGVDRCALFPSLDGLAAHIEWLQSKRE